MDVNLQEFKESLKSLKSTYSADKGILSKLQQDQAERKVELTGLLTQKDAIGLKKALLQEACTEARKNAKDVLENISTQGLQFIMGDHMSMQINLDEAKVPPEAEFIVHSEYEDYDVDNDPAEEDGGGTADVISIANFFAMNHLVGKQNVAPLFFDEPSKFVSAGLSDGCARFLYEMCHYMKKQVFMVTHDVMLAPMGDVAYHFQLNNKGKTVVTQLNAATEA